jgi:hypothetical protein
MNVSEAIHTQTLLAWLTDPPDGESGESGEVEGMAVSAARFLAARAQAALGAGPDADEVGEALRARLAGYPTHGDR